MIISKYKPTIPLEYDEQKEVVNYLDKLISYGSDIKYTAIPNSTYTKSWSQKVKNKASGLRAGLPDMFLIINNTPLFIEMKRSQGGTVSSEQKQWIEAIQKAGIDCYVCKGAGEAINVIKQYL